MAKRKKDKKNEDSVQYKEPPGQLQVYQHLHDGGAGKKREAARN